MMKKILLFLMALAFVLPAAIAGEKTVTISRNEGIYDDGTGVYYCTKGGITMTFSSGLNNVNYLVEHQQVVFDIFSTNYVIKKIKFNCLDNTTDDNLDCFYWGPSTISEFTGAPYVPTGSYTWSGYIGTWVGGTTPSKYVKFVTEAKPVRFGSVEITYDKEFGDIYDLVRYNTEIQNGQTYALVSKYDSRALGKEEFHGDDPVMTFSSTPVTLLNFDATLNNYLKVKVTDEVSLMKLESSGNSDRPWYIKIGDNYLRRRTGTMQGSGGAANGQGWNIFTVSSIPSGSETYFRTRITVENTNNNALIRYSHNSSETSNNETFAIRHYNGGDLFRVIDYNSSNNQYANNQRVYLYKPAEPYIITTECLPSANDGYITLSDGVLLDNQGNQTSQMGDTVKFFVGPTNGWGVGTVTVTNLTTNEVTTLTPTSTSDFGNNYQFPMPGANVHVTANFIQPYEIHTVNNPVDGGDFNFLNGYTDFNGQTASNEGKTVTFTIEPADDYMVSSVTYTDDVTGQTTTLTPDADGVYTFVMPGNSVTLTANYEMANDLYLLGTANGRTGWVPYGPKFTYDPSTETYYLDVYFKGYNDDPNTDPAYGYFSLTKKIDEGGNWNNIAGYRLAATANQYWVEDGDTHIPLSGDHPDWAFKIKPGVYRIEVNQAMTEMSITEYPLSLTFDPAGGVPGNGTVVDPNTEVTISSNLQDLVHAINPNEDPVLFYNTIDNWATQENDNTRVITNIGETTVTASAALGQYLTVNGAATYEIIGDLYLLGTANGRSSWVPYGPKFTYDADADEYYIDVYFKGYNDDPNAEDGYGYFSLSTRIGSNDNDWNSINGYRIFATSHDYLVEDGNTYNNCFQTYDDQAFKIPAGVYRITVNRAKTQMTIAEYPLTLTFDPVSGSTVASGDNVTITSNLDELVHAINPNEDNASFKNSTDGGATWDNDNTATITAEGTTTTVDAEANIGYIIVTGTAEYTIPAPTVYSITTQVNPEGSNAGTITAPSGSVAGVTVNFTVTDTDPSVYTLTGVEVVDSNNGIVATLEPSADGNYSFTMPSDDVTIHADYVRTPYNVTTSWSPSEGGAIWLNNVNIPQTVSVANGSDVVFGVSPATASGYRLSSLVVMNVTTGQEITPTSSGSNEYTFTMPTSDVTVTATFVLNTPLSYIEYPNTFKDGDPVTVTDELIGTWMAKNYLWAKDQGQRSNFFVEKDPSETVLDYLREGWKIQHHEWDQSNWVMLDFSTIPGFEDWETNNATYQAMMTAMSDYVDNKIKAGTITGRYSCLKSLDVLGFNDDEIKVQHVIHLDQLPDYVIDPTTNNSENSLGYPGFVQDPREEAGKYYADPSSYMYNHYTPANFLIEQLGPDGIAPKAQEQGADYTLFFMLPKDQEVAHVWGAWYGKMEYYDEFAEKTRTDDVFEVLYSQSGNDINYNNVGGAFRVASWDYNRLLPDVNDIPRYGEPEGEMVKGNAYEFHIAINYSPYIIVGPRGSQRDAVLGTSRPEYFNVYPLDMSTPEDSYTAVREVQSSEAVIIKSITYYNVMGQASSKPFEGINIVVTRYSDGSIMTTKVLR